MRYADLGKLVKSKYPQYKDIDDDKLGRLVVKKYPQYASKIDRSSENPFYKIASFLGIQQPIQTMGLISNTRNVGNVIDRSNEGIKNLSEQSLSLIRQAKQVNDPQERARLLEQSRKLSGQIDVLGSGAEKAGNLLQKLGDVKTDQSNLEFAGRKGLATAGQSLAWMLPGAKSIKGAFLTGAARGAGMTAGNAPEIKSWDDAFDELKNLATTGALMEGGLKILGTGVNKVGKWFKNQAKEDVIAKLKPTKMLRKEAHLRKIDLGDEMIKHYTNDPEENINLARKKLKKYHTLFDKYTNKKYPNKKVNIVEIINDVFNKLDKKAHPMDSNRLQEWRLSWIKKIPQYGGMEANLGSAAKLKSIAGESGYSQSSEVVDKIVGKADALLERKLRKAILDSVTGSERLRLEKLLREQEKALFVKKLNENAIFSKIPKSLARKIGSLMFPTSLARQTVGNATESLVDLLGGKPAKPTPSEFNAKQSNNILDLLPKVNLKKITTKPKVYINPTLSALQRYINQENKHKTTTTNLP